MNGTCFCFDLDGTVTEQEILPLIASELGLEQELGLLTRLSMDGVIPFEDSFRLRFAILKHCNLDRIHRVIESVRINSEIERFIRTNKENCYIITGNLDVWISPLIERLGCRFYSSTSEDDGQNFIISKVLRKNEPVLSLKEKYKRVIAIGDGFNDLPMFDVADIGVAFNGVHKSPRELVSTANYVTLNGLGLCRLLNML